ncbi:unnamed protein product [Penicillium nalgiovense]|nr:unnamed protein product [Penicillium nalgiovense]
MFPFAAGLFPISPQHLTSHINKQYINRFHSSLCLRLPKRTTSLTVKYTVASGLFRQIEDKTKVAADERAPSRLPPSSPPPSHYCGVLNLWHRDTWIHHGSAMFIASGFVTRVYCLNKLSCAPQRGFFEASQIAMSLNATWHGW